MTGLEGSAVKVLQAIAPSSLCFILGFGFGWFRFIPELGNVINQLVFLLIQPSFFFNFIAQIDPFSMNYHFIFAEILSKVIIIVVIAVWKRFSRNGSLSWSITSFLLSTFTNSLIVGVPLVGGLYGQQFVDLVVQGSVIQSIVYFPVVTIVLEYRSVTDSSVNATEIEDSEGNLQLDVEKAVVTIPQRGSRLKDALKKLVKNPNCGACLIGVCWAFISNRYKLTETKQIIQDLISPISNAAILTNMFAIGTHMAEQGRLISCRISSLVLALFIKFFAGPLAMAIICFIVGLRGDVLRVAIIQSALPKSMTSFMIAKEYGLHADVISTAFLADMIVTIPVMIGFHVVLGFLP